MLLKCSVNFVRLGDFSSFCSCIHRITSAESNLMNSWESRRVICSAKSADLNWRTELGLVERVRPLVSRSGSLRACLASNFCMNFDLRARARLSSPSATNSAMNSVRSSVTVGSSKSQSARPSTTRTSRENDERATRWNTNEFVQVNKNWLNRNYIMAPLSYDNRFISGYFLYGFPANVG